MDKSSFKELLEFLVIAVPLWGVWFTLRGGLRRIDYLIRTRLERMEYVIGHKLIRVESAICLESGKTRRHTTDIFAPKPQQAAAPAQQPAAPAQQPAGLKAPAPCTEQRSQRSQRPDQAQHRFATLLNVQFARFPLTHDAVELLRNRQNCHTVNCTQQLTVDEINLF